MARTNTLSNFLTDIATAIKQKKDDQTDIQASEFDTEILALPAQGVYQHKTVPITQNGTHTVTPDSGYDAIDELTINVAVPEKRLQTKNYTFTQNANLQLTPEIGYDGFDQIGLNINVPTGAGGVKLFTSEQAMQADPNPQVGGLAIVYGESATPVKESHTYKYIIFPATVQFETAVTDYHYSYGGGSSVNWMSVEVIDDTSAQIRYEMSLGTTEVIDYTSSDGMLYTKVSGINQLQGTFYMYDTDEVCSEFILGVEDTFTGLYTYSDTITDNSKAQSIDISNINMNTFTYDNSAYNWSGNYSYQITYDTLKPVLTAMLNDDTVTKHLDEWLYMYIKDDKYYVISAPTILEHIGAYQNEGIIGIVNYSVSSSETTHTVKIYELDIEHTTYTLVNTLTSSSKSFTTSDETTYYLEYIPIIPDSFVFKIRSYNIDSYTATTAIRTIYQVSGQSYYSYTYKSSNPTCKGHPYKSGYIFAPTQFNLEAAQALQGTSAYSNEGVVNGTIVNLGGRTITPSTEQQTISAGYTTGVTIKPVTYLIDSDIKYNNIKEGVNILGIDGEIPDIEVHYIGDGYQNQVYNGSASNTVNKATMFAYKVGNHGGSISTGIYDKDCNWVGLLSGSNETWSVESNGTLAHKTSITAPNLQFGMWSSVQTDGVITGTWRNNQCRVWYVPYGSGYRRYIRCVTFTKNANGEIVYDSSLPRWQFILPSQPTEATYTELTNAGIIIDPTNEDMVTVSCYAYVSGTNYKNSRILFYSLKLDDYSGSGWGTMTCGDVITGIPTGNNQMMPDACRYFQYRNGNKTIVYGNYGGAYSNQPIQILFTDENGFVKYITTNNTLILAFKNDMSKCITSNRLYNMTVDYINHTVTLGNYISISTNVGRNIIGDRYDNYLFGNSSTSGYPDVYYNKLYRINWETGVITQLLSAGLEYSSNVIHEYPCGNLSTASIFADGSWPTSSYGSFLSIKIPKKIDYMSYNGVDYRPDKPTQTKTITPTTSQQVITPDEGYELASVIIDGVTSDIDSNIQPENIRNGVTILGVEGNYERPDASM